MTNRSDTTRPPISSRALFAVRALGADGGNAMVFALVTVLIVGLLTAMAYNRVSRSDTRSGEARNFERAQRAADTAVELAFKRVLVTGSSEYDERRCSSLDEPRPAQIARDPDTGEQLLCVEGTSRAPLINGYTATDGSYSYTVTGIGPDRTVNAVGTYKAATGKIYAAKRSVPFPITPRVLRYALFASGEDAADAVTVGAGARLLLPPTYRTVAKQFVRGGDLGANGKVTVESGGQINVRDADTQVLYDKFFVDPDQGEASDAATRLLIQIDAGELHERSSLLDRPLALLALDYDPTLENL